MSKRDFLLELGCEELPPKSLFRSCKVTRAHSLLRLHRMKLIEGSISGLGRFTDVLQFFLVLLRDEPLVASFVLAHRRKHYVLDDHGVTTDAGRNARGPNLVFSEDV